MTKDFRLGIYEFDLATEDFHFVQPLGEDDPSRHGSYVCLGNWLWVNVLSRDLFYSREEALVNARIGYLIAAIDSGAADLEVLEARLQQAELDKATKLYAAE